MASLSSLVERHRLDAAVAWLATLALVAAGMRLWAGGDPQWAAFVALLVGVALVPTVATRDPAVTMPGELVVLVAVPVVVRAAGLLPQATPFLAVGGLALLVAVALDAFTSLETTPRFAVVFVVVATMAFAGAWTVGAWAVDLALGTAFLAGKTELMWDLVTAALMGLVAGVVFEFYFHRSDRADRLRAAEPRPASSVPGGSDASSVIGDSARHRAGVRAMQAVLAGIAALAAVGGNGTLFVNSAGPLAVTFLPGLLRREYGYPLHAGLALWVTVAATLHAVGALGPYETVGWYDSVTHAVSATLVAAVGYTAARGVELHTGEVDFSPRFRGAFVVLFVLAVGVLWEIFEFGTAGLATMVGSEPVLAQYGTGDIVADLVYDSVGAVAVAAYGGGFLEPLSRAVADRVGPLAGGRE